MKHLRYIAEAVLIHILFFIFGIMPAPAASALGGWIGRTFGPIMAVSRKAERHLNLCLPQLDTAQRKIIIRDMWDNLGRVIAEYPHLETIARDYTQIQGDEHASADEGQPRIFIAGHLANWEICGAAALVKLGIPIELTYRAPNNHWTAGLLDKIRSLKGRIKTHPKSGESGRALMTTMKSGGALGILIDQKYNEGVESLFFGQPAMTNPIFAKLCQKYRAKLIPTQIIRKNGCHFDIIIHPPLPTLSETGEPLPITDVITQAHNLLETWITDYPGQWIWLHRRWKA